MKCEELTKLYGEIAAVNNITVDLQSNAIGLLGPNGSGKTTLIKLLTGLIKPTNGSVELGVDPADIRVVPDYPYLPQELTVNAWISYIEDIHGPNQLGSDIQSIFQLRGDTKIKYLSAGQTRKVALLPTFYGTPKLFILDEPTNFLDITSRQQVIQLLWSYIQKSGAKLILATHRTDEMRLFSDDVLLMKEGRIVRQVSNKKEPPISFTLEVSNNNEFEKLLISKEMDFQKSDVQSSLKFIVKPSNELWDVIGEFCKNAGQIQSFNSNDILEHAIEELLQ